MILYNLRHQNIVQFSGVLWSPPDFGIAMPLIPHGSLSAFIGQYENIGLAKVQHFLNFLNRTHTCTYLHIHAQMHVRTHRE